MKRILLILAALLLALLAAEGALRLAGPLPPGPAPLLCRFHPVLGWEPEPGRRVSWTPPGGGAIELEVGAQGLRGACDPAAKGERERRILALGDAATLGSTVAAAQAYPEALAALLAGRSIEARAFNAGVDRFTLDQQLLWFRSRGPGLRPDLVLLGFGREGLHRLVRERCGRFPKPRFRMDENKRLVSPVLPLSEPAQAPFREFVDGLRLVRLFAGPDRPMLAPPSPPIPAEYGPYLVKLPDEVSECWYLAAALLRELAAEVRGCGALLLAFPIPDHAQVSGAEAHRILRGIGLAEEMWNIDRPTAFFASIAAELGVAVLDPLGYFRGAAKEGRSLFLPGETGLAPEGHKLLAELLERKLVELRWYGLR